MPLMTYEYHIQGLFEGGKLKLRPRTAQPHREINPRLFKTREAAQYLGVSPWTVRRLGLPVVPGKHLRFDVRDLDEWIERRKKG